MAELAAPGSYPVFHLHVQLRRWLKLVTLLTVFDEIYEPYPC
jgi:hypothetical protein